MLSPTHLPDAITGTAEWQVVDWYVETSLNAMESLRGIQSAALAALTQAPADTQFTCVNNTGVLPDLAPGASITLTVFNQLGTMRSFPVCRYTNNKDLSVKDALAGVPIAAQILPTLASYTDPTAPLYELCFAGLMPPLGYNSFVVTRTATDAEDPHTFTPALSGDDVVTQQRGESLGAPEGYVVLQNEFLRAQFASSNGALTQIQRLSFPTLDISINQTFATYEDYGNAYEFFPLNNTPTAVPQSGVKAYFVQGPIVSMVYQVYGSTLLHALRLFNCSDCSFLESSVIVGPLDMNTAFVNVFQTSLDNGAVLYSGTSPDGVLRTECCCGLAACPVLSCSEAVTATCHVECEGSFVVGWEKQQPC